MLSLKASTPSKMEMVVWGRMIILKECLAHDLIPVIIQDNNKPVYMNHLQCTDKIGIFRSC